VAVAKKSEAVLVDLFANYDVKRVQEALRNSAGALAGVDRQKLLDDLRAARTQDTGGRPS
jgi:hypothetical protein